MQVVQVKLSEGLNSFILDEKEMKECTREDMKNYMFSILLDHIVLCFPGILFLYVFLCVGAHILDTRTYHFINTIFPILIIISFYCIPAYIVIKHHGNTIGRMYYKFEIKYIKNNNYYYLIREWFSYAIPYTIICFIFHGVGLLLFIMINLLFIYFDKKHRNPMDILLKTTIMVEKEG